MAGCTSQCITSSSGRVCDNSFRAAPVRKRSSTTLKKPLPHGRGSDACSASHTSSEPTNDKNIIASRMAYLQGYETLPVTPSAPHLRNLRINTIDLQHRPRRRGITARTAGVAPVQFRFRRARKVVSADCAEDADSGDAVHGKRRSARRAGTFVRMDQGRKYWLAMGQGVTLDAENRQRLRGAS